MCVVPRSHHTSRRKACLVSESPSKTSSWPARHESTSEELNHPYPCSCQLASGSQDTPVVQTPITPEVPLAGANQSCSERHQSARHAHVARESMSVIPSEPATSGSANLPSRGRAQKPIPAIHSVHGVSLYASQGIAHGCAATSERFESGKRLRVVQERSDQRLPELSTPGASDMRDSANLGAKTARKGEEGTDGGELRKIRN